MKVITKRADELKAGDMLVWNGMAGRVVVSVGKPAGGSVELVTQGADSATSTTYMGADTRVLVAALELTPAQQHADALLALVESLPATAKITELLDKIRPPVPPTADELATALIAAHEGKDPDIKQRLAILVGRWNRAKK